MSQTEGVSMIEGTCSEARRIESWPPPSLAGAIQTAGSGEAAPSFAARLPIYDRALDVHAYELRFRAGDAEVATADTVVTSFAGIGLDALVGGRSGFVSVTRDFVMHGLVTLLPAGRVALELHRSDLLDPQVLAELTQLGELGYTIVLDDFAMRDDCLPLLEVADYLKLDVRAFTEDQLVEQVAQLERYDVRLIAAGIEDHRTFDLCREAGFDYFQGYYFCRPRTVPGHGIPANRLAHMRMMAVLQDPDCELDDLEHAISNDLGLSIRLLRWINSAYFLLPRKVGSVREALMMLGVRNVRSWALLMTLAGIEDQPGELIRTAMTRAKMCELVAQALDRPDADAHFTVGLFSVVDAFMDTSMRDVVSELPLSAEVSDALLERSGHLGEVLDWVLAYERGDFGCLTPSPRADAVLRDAYVVALRFADEAESAVPAHAAVT
ncbi:MAG TPA: HDOD domain-containing protein [Gaiellales bacterium]|nr:HDOD domain-containing protein [Gaiellales bacterium]